MLENVFKYLICLSTVCFCLLCFCMHAKCSGKCPLYFFNYQKLRVWVRISFTNVPAYVKRKEEKDAKIWACSANGFCG
jgi:hypothetical protein